MTGGWGQTGEGLQFAYGGRGAHGEGGRGGVGRGPGVGGGEGRGARGFFFVIILSIVIVIVQTFASAPLLLSLVLLFAHALLEQFNVNEIVQKGERIALLSLRPLATGMSLSQFDRRLADAQEPVQVLATRHAAVAILHVVEGDALGRGDGSHVSVGLCHADDRAADAKVLRQILPPIATHATALQGVATKKAGWQGRGR